MSVLEFQPCVWHQPCLVLFLWQAAGAPAGPGFCATHTGHRAPGPRHSESPSVAVRLEAELREAQVLSKEGSLASPLPGCLCHCRQYPTLSGPTSLPRSPSSWPSISACRLETPCDVKQNKVNPLTTHLKQYRQFGKCPHKQKGWPG